MRHLIAARWRAHGLHPVRSAIGAGLAVGVAALCGLLVVGAQSPFAVASIASSALLIFAIPASPLAQPRAVLGGNLVSALIGVTAARLIGEPILAASLAVALSIYAMHKLRCLHPPAAAVAMIEVIGGPAIHAQGYAFVLAPVMLNSVVLLAVAYAFNNLAGSRYPHRPEPIVPPEAPPRHSERDIAAVLDEMEDLPDIDPADLLAIVNALEARRLVTP